MEGYKAIDSFFGISEDDKELAKEELKTEKEPCVLKAAIEKLGNEGGSDPEIGAFLIAMSKDENAKLRETAAFWIGSSWNESMEGAVEAELTLMQDENPDVSSAACRYCGKLGDPSVIAPLVEILNDEEKCKLHGDCMASLSTLWLDYPFHEKTNEEAYRATLDYFKKTPRDGSIPASGTFYAILSIAESNFDAWKEKADYYNSEEIVAAMTEIALDPDAASQSRREAIKVIKAHGGKEALEALKPTVDGLTDGHAERVQSELEEALQD